MATCEDCGKPITHRARWCKQCRGKYTSENKKGKPILLTSGPNNPHWQGGGKSYRGADWLNAKKRAKARDGYKCVQCGSSEKLNVHHKKPASETGGEWDNSLINLQTLCSSCHGKVHHPCDFQTTCPICGVKHFAKRYNSCCSQACRRESRRRASERINHTQRRIARTCAQCGKPFSLLGRQRYCSESCLNLATHERDRQRIRTKTNRCGDCDTPIWKPARYCNKCKHRHTVRKQGN